MKLFCCIFILFVICLIQLSEGRGNAAKKCEKALRNTSSKVKEFLNFIKRYHKKYKTKKECVKRFHVFKENLKKAKEIQKTEKGTAVYGASLFADLTDKEFEKYVGEDLEIPKKRVKIKKRKIPSEFDWREEGVLNPVANQGHHNKTCYAFAAVANVESVYAVKHKHLYRLSEQQIVDCYNRTERGSKVKALQYLVDKGAMLQVHYPYTGHTKDCEYDSEKVVVQPDSVATLSKSEKKIAIYLYKNGPVAASLNATYLHLYKYGIIDQDDCRPPTKHAVVLVGYGVARDEGNKPIWIARNSWGPKWGEKGYFRIARGKGCCCINSKVCSAVFN